MRCIAVAGSIRRGAPRLVHPPDPPQGEDLHRLLPGAEHGVRRPVLRVPVPRDVQGLLGLGARRQGRSEREVLDAGRSRSRLITSRPARAVAPRAVRRWCSASVVDRGRRSAETYPVYMSPASRPQYSRHGGGGIEAAAGCLRPRAEAASSRSACVSAHEVGRQSPLQHGGDRAQRKIAGAWRSPVPAQRTAAPGPGRGDDGTRHRVRVICRRQWTCGLSSPRRSSAASIQRRPSCQSALRVQSTPLTS